MGHLKFTSSMLMIALFTIAIVGFAVNFAIDNESAVMLGDDADFNSVYTNQRDNVTEFFEDANASSTALIFSTLEQGDETTSSGGQFKGSVGTSLNMATNVIRVGYKKIFGADNGFGIFLTALISILIYFAAAYAYKAWIGRNPD